MAIEQIAIDTDEQLEERERFDGEFYSSLSRAKTFLKESADDDDDVTSQNVNANSVGGHISVRGSSSGTGAGAVGFSNNLKLPVIELPKFEGNYDNWLEFRDSFDSLIHQNQSISDVQKFHYLRASLSRGALEIVASLELSSDNYTIAWDLICKRYNNNRILVQNHVKALFNLDKINEESSLSLRKIVDNVTKHIRALKILNEPTDNWDTLIIYLISLKLDPITAREWEQKKAVYNKPTFENLKDFLKERADFLESLDGSKNVKKIPKNKVELRTKSFFSAQAYCPFCKMEHYIQECANFKQLNVHERLIEVKKRKLWINCLRPGHLIKQCRSGSCKICRGRHNSLLHISDSGKGAQEAVDAQSNESIVCSTKSVSNFNNHVLLSTVSVRLFDNKNKIHIARALLDAGSQSSFITSSLAAKLNLNLSNINIKVCGLNQAESTIRQKASLHIQSFHNSFSINASCLVVPEITGTLPNFPVNLNSLQIPGHLKLADPNFHLPGKVDILLGADHFWHVMCVGQVKLENHNALLHKTKFGWIISGSISAASSQIVQCNLSTNSDLDKQLSRFWEVEEVSISKHLSREEKLCESHFVETFQRNDKGQFIVTIPLKENLDVLGDSFENAKKRLLSLERKFERQPKFKEEYSKFINEYISLEHMSKVKSETKEHSYFLPHHGVIKESSLTTKLRVVFDASCATSSGYSLNDLQMVGATLQPDLFSALIRFRKYNYVIAGDVEKMYRMVLIVPEQRALQRILWRETPAEPIDTYELATVTYGTSSAAFLAIRCLYQIGLDCADESPVISEIIKKHFYVDDFLSGASSINDAIFIANEVARYLGRSGFRLRKWISNSPEVLDHIESNDKVNSIDFGIHENTKTLGLVWSAQTDSLTYNINDSVVKQITKRSILSEVSQIFDPLGLLSPSIIIAKIILQELWSEKLSWDESVPNYLHCQWLRFRSELKCLNDLKINRQITCSDSDSIEIHGFSDASTRAFGACVYARCKGDDGNFETRLICSKSKVAPLKTQTVPRLELMAAVLLVQLIERVKSSIDVCINRIVYWSDSTVVLGWLKIEPNLLQPFVANRVARIQELVDTDNWRHVPTLENPADHVSRGVMPENLASLKIYWHGPDWLKHDESHWPVLHSLQIDLPEFRKNVHTHVETFTSNPSLFERYSYLSKLERIVAYCLRFKENCLKKTSNRYLGPLLYSETAKASLRLLKMSQIESFPNEISLLSKDPTKLNKGPLAKLSPFLDNNGMIRVGGRLKHSALPYHKKHPFLLSSKHIFTKLLFKREHLSLLHAGPQQLLYHIREKFWPLSARNLAKKTVHNCIKCFRARPKIITPLMGNLPKSRVSPAPPFYTTGVDYCGPFLIKDRNGRGCKITKGYVSLFICFATRSIHLELVSDLSKNSFMAALRRFIARRGKPYQMYSDNGTNFVAASSDLKPLGEFLKVNAADLAGTVENEGIAWSFIPAHSPHFGGLWEAGVKSTKHHLKRIAGNVKLTFEQFNTLLVQIEAVLNSRPISPLSSDPSDFTPLCPAHFLIGRPLTSVADPNLLEINTNRLDKFQQIQQLQQHFWKRWSLEYISELQQRQKWLKSARPLQVNDLVLIKDDHQPPLKWLLGRVLSVHPGSDGVARVATIKTTTSTLRRSFAKLCPLPTNDEIQGNQPVRECS